MTYASQYIYTMTHASTDPFELLADPQRRHIVEVLRGGEQPVGALVARLDIHQSGVSRHLGILEAGGLVRMRPDGRRRLYALRPEPFRELDLWIARFRGLWEGRLDALGQALARQQQGRRRSGRKGHAA